MGQTTELIGKHNEVFRRIVPMKEALSNKESGSMEFTVGFFSKVAPGADDSSSSIPQAILDKEEFKKARKSTLSDLEAAVAITPPNEDYLSGILGIQVSITIKFFSGYNSFIFIFICR
jgi:hypothetical protein